MEDGKKFADGRLWSLDALRGFDMLFITGLAGLIVSLCVALGFGKDCWLATQMTHVGWHGLRQHDTIFPLFLFIAGVSFPFSYAKQRERGWSTGKIVAKTVWRGLALFALGLTFQNALQFDFAHLRIWSVLGRIGLSWMCAALLFVAFPRKWRLAIAPALLLGYGLLMYFGHAPDFPDADRFSEKGSIICWIDRALMDPPHIYTKYYDPEGLMGIVTGTVTAMLGMFAGEFVKSATLSGARKALTMFGVGAALWCVGWGIDWLGVCPVNKKIWTPTFVLTVGGYSFAVFALFYWMIDVKGWRKWTFYFRVVGMNSITIYLAQRIFNLGGVRNFFFGGVVKLFPAPWTAVADSLAYMAVVWLFLYFLYRKNTFLRV